MAFSQGTKITASELNSVNAAWNNYYNTWGNGYGDHTGTTPWFYVHSTTGRFARVALHTGGFFPGVWAYLYKMSSIDPNAPAGSQTTVWEVSHSTAQSSWNHDLYAQNYGGPGWYRIFAGGSRARHQVWLYCGQQGCVRGDYLTYWDDPLNSGNRIPGTKLTVSVLNSGRAGTF